MAIRFWSNPGRIIVSRPGFNAGPSLADQNKILDSDWNFSGLVIAKGRITDPSTARGGGDDAFYTDDATAITINFPSIGYIPTAFLINVHNNDAIAKDYALYTEMFGPYYVQGVDGGPFTTAIHGVVYSDHIIIPRLGSSDNGASGPYLRYVGTIQYYVLAIGAD